VVGSLSFSDILLRKGLTEPLKRLNRVVAAIVDAIQFAFFRNGRPPSAVVNLDRKGGNVPLHYDK
jgi:hypothetical protein